MFCIHSSTIGSNQHLLFDKKINWVDDIPEDAWTVHSKSISSNRDLMKAFELAGHSINTDPPKQHIKTITSLSNLDFEKVLWKFCMRKKQWDSWVGDIVKNISEALDDIDISYYQNYFILEKELLDNLNKIKPNLELIYKYKKQEKHMSVLSCLGTFLPQSDGLCKKIVYNQSSSVSGRLTIKSGPNILTLRKDLRKIITSSYEGGKVYQLDYVSLEPRLALEFSGKDVPEDVYDDINENIFQGEQSRDTIKLFVLASLFGAAPKRLSKQIYTSLGIDMSLGDCRTYLPAVKKYFGIAAKIKSLEFECLNFDNKILNHYGRIINVPDPKGYKIYNHYIQSSAVTVALLGFYQIYKYIQENNLKIKIIAILHDAAFLDFHPDELHRIEDLKKQVECIPKISTKMSLKCESV